MGTRTTGVALAVAVAVALALALALLPVPAGTDAKTRSRATARSTETQRCDATQRSGESFAAFVARLGGYQHGCLIAGTYGVGTFRSFKAGQVLKAKAGTDGRRQAVTIRGELLLDKAGLVLEDLRIQGTTSHAAVDVKASGVTLRHLDVGSYPANHATQGIMVGGQSLTVSNVVIERSRIHHQGSDPGFHHAVYCQNLSGGRLTGSWLHDNAAYGVQLYPACRGLDMAYNVVADNGLGVVFANTTASSTFRNGIVAFNRNTARERGIRTSSLSGTGNAVRTSATFRVEHFLHGLAVSNLDDEDPLFADRARRDYRLRAASPSREELGTYADLRPGPR